MRGTIRKVTAVVSVLICCAPASTRADQRQVARPARLLPDLAYIVHGKLWLRSLSGAAWRVPAPRSIAGLSWSPDGSAIALEGRHHLAVMALRGHTGRIVFSRRIANCCGAQPAWSPNGRYLSFSVDTRDPELANVWLWDRATGRTRLLVREAAAEAWSNDSTRLAVAAGTALDKAPRNPTAEVVNVTSGQVTYLGKGIPGSWSPDDRFLGFDHLRVCGATGCFEQEAIMPSSGGPRTILDRDIRGGWLTDESWAPRRSGYAYDRWLLGPRGHVQRRVPGRFRRVDSWSPDGRWVAVQSLTRSLRVVLTLIDVDTGRSRRLFVSAPEGACDACMNAAYELTWNPSSTALAVLTLYVYGGLKDVNPSLHVYTLAPGSTRWSTSKGIQLEHPYPTVVGWVNHDREFILHSGRTLFRDVPGRRGLVPIARGLPYSEFSFLSGYGAPVALRPGS